MTMYFSRTAKRITKPGCVVALPFQRNDRFTSFFWKINFATAYYPGFPLLLMFLFSVPNGSSRQRREAFRFPRKINKPLRPPDTACHVSREKCGMATRDLANSSLNATSRRDRDTGLSHAAACNNGAADSGRLRRVHAAISLLAIGSSR